MIGLNWWKHRRAQNFTTDSVARVQRIAINMAILAMVQYNKINNPANQHVGGRQRIERFPRSHASVLRRRRYLLTFAWKINNLPENMWNEWLNLLVSAECCERSSNAASRFRFTRSAADGRLLHKIIVSLMSARPLFDFSRAFDMDDHLTAALSAHSRHLWQYDTIYYDVPHGNGWQVILLMWSSVAREFP